MDDSTGVVWPEVQRLCSTCGQLCNRADGPDVLWNCRCTDDCQAHHRDCGRGGYVCLWCRAGGPDRESKRLPRRTWRTWSEMIDALEAETGRPVTFTDSQRQCPNCGGPHSREDSELCSTCLFLDLPI